MTPLKILTPLPATVSHPALAQLLTDASFTAISDTEWTANCFDGDGTPVLLILVPVEPRALTALELAVRTAAGTGERVIAIWHKADSTSLPVSLQDYGAALVAWDPKALHAAVCGEPSWQDAGGGTLPDADTKRNRC
jgi:hypothetical protein